jgi:hypothetical protein
MPSAMRRAFWLACAVLCSGAPRPLHAAASVREQPNPHDAFASFDCALRQLALEFASHLQPHRSRPELQAIADALNNDTYATCRNLTVPGNPPPLSAPVFPIPSGETVIYVDQNGSDSSAGSVTAPLRTVAAAVARVAGKPGATIVLRGGTHYLAGGPLLLNATHSGLTMQNYPNETAFISGAVPLQSLAWQHHHGSIYKAQLGEEIQLDQLLGLRVNGGRAIRARFPNFDPEQGFGPGLLPNGALPIDNSSETPLTDIYPAVPDRNASGAVQTFARFNLGIGGPCSKFTPPAGYWCGTHTAGGGGLQYTGTPSGIVIAADGEAKVLPNFPYANASGAIVQMLRPNMWDSWMFEVDRANATSLFFGKGGFQGARGCGDHPGQLNGCSNEFYIENVLEELDGPREWFFDETTRTLYYYHTGPEPIASISLEATRLKELIRVVGTQKAPVRGVTIRGLSFKDTSYTYMDPHEMASGGDWTIVRGGAVFMEGVEATNIEACNFTRLDSNALLLSGYTRNATILDNSFTYIGGNTIGLMGKTTMPEQDPRTPFFGWDGRGGEQPRYTTVAGNIAHHLGIWEKQSSFIFQSKSAVNNYTGNIHFRSPRCAVNYNE